MSTFEAGGGYGREPLFGGFAWSRATRRGLRDRAALAGLAPHARGGSGTAALPALSTAYVDEVTAAAARASHRLRRRLIRRERRMIVRIHHESVQVVACYDGAGSRLPTALARFGGWVGEWRTDADQARTRLEAVLERSNEKLARYWAGVCRPGGPLGFQAALSWSAPAPLTLDPSWLHPDTFLFATDGVAGLGTPANSAVTARALAILVEQGQSAGPRRTP
jgi:hypothetical protein